MNAQKDQEYNVQEDIENLTTELESARKYLERYKDYTWFNNVKEMLDMATNNPNEWITSKRNPFRD